MRYVVSKCSWKESADELQNSWQAAGICSWYDLPSSGMFWSQWPLVTSEYLSKSLECQVSFARLKHLHCLAPIPFITRSDDSHFYYIIFTLGMAVSILNLWFTWAFLSVLPLAKECILGSTPQPVIFIHIAFHPFVFVLFFRALSYFTDCDMLCAFFCPTALSGSRAKLVSAFFNHCICPKISFTSLCQLCSRETCSFSSIGSTPAALDPTIRPLLINESARFLCTLSRNLVFYCFLSPYGVLSLSLRNRESKSLPGTRLSTSSAI